MNEDIGNKLTYLANRLREKLWFKPLIIGLISIATVLISKAADVTGLWGFSPDVSVTSLDKLLSIMASSMMMVATFSVGSMLAAYSSAGNSASPRSFRLLVADDSSQHALSAFVGAFIFSIVGLVAVDNDFFGPNGIFVLFIFTLIVFGIVIIVFVRWMDRIARLGRMNNTLDKVESATTEALKYYARFPLHNAHPIKSEFPSDFAVTARATGYIQHIDLVALQKWAKETNAKMQVNVLPGSYVTPAHELARVNFEKAPPKKVLLSQAEEAFKIGKERMYDDDPRFGLIVLSQIAGRALSPAVNDPGTAIDVIGIQVRLLVQWNAERQLYRQRQKNKPVYDRIHMPELSVSDMFDDAFTAIARDGRGAIEVVVRLLKGLASLNALGDSDVRKASEHSARNALLRAENSLFLEEEVNRVRRLSELNQF